MVADLINQTIEQLGKVSNILVLLPSNPSGDNVSAALALRSFLKKLEKEVTVVAGSAPDAKYSFLDGFINVETNLHVAKNFVIQVSTKRAQIDELSYRKEDDHLGIFIRPKEGAEFKESDVTFNTADYPFGAIVTIGITNLDMLGDFYTKNAEMFFQTPIVNVDYRAINESFGQFNLIHLNATSNAEIIFDLISKYEANLIDETIATSLLTGIISETNSFQHSRTTPQTFMKASQLVSSGARQQEIVGSLFKTKSISFLKLWGRALARLKQDDDIGLVYTVITQSDFEKSHATDKEVEMIIPELNSQLKMAKVFLVFQEASASTTNVFCLLPQSINPQTIFGGFQLSFVTSSLVKFTIPASLTDAENTITKVLKDEMIRLDA